MDTRVEYLVDCAEFLRTHGGILMLSAEDPDRAISRIALALKLTNVQKFSTLYEGWTLEQVVREVY
jgi:hypothetical protein